MLIPPAQMGFSREERRLAPRLDYKPGTIWNTPTRIQETQRGWPTWGAEMGPKGMAAGVSTFFPLPCRHWRFPRSVCPTCSGSARFRGGHRLGNTQRNEQKTGEAEAPGRTDIALHCPSLRGIPAVSPRPPERLPPASPVPISADAHCFILYQ